jgi:uncharacterized Zn finger protein
VLVSSRSNSNIPCPICGDKDTESRVYRKSPCFIMIACFNCAMFYTVESRDLLMIGLAKMGESCSKVAGFLTGIR